jgi:hydroxyacylglutathione hydrolase
MKLIPQPAFADNYTWMLHDGHQTLVVAPGNEQAMLETLQPSGGQLETILVTHHQPTAGVAA